MSRTPATSHPSFAASAALTRKWEDWIEAARLGRRCAGTGHRLPLSDLILAAVALRHDAEIYTTDPHFDLIREINRFAPAP